MANSEFARVLGRVLRRPAVVPLPRAAIVAALGEMGEHVLLDGAIVLPRRLEADGFMFEHPRLEGALRHLLGA